MRVVIQRVTKASVTISGIINGSINKGLLVFVGIEESDNDEDIKWLSTKIINLRIFDDDAGVMNRSLKEIDGELLLISQFTLHATTKKGNRPGYSKAARPVVAIPIYYAFINQLENDLEKEISTGEFGAYM